MTLKTSDVQCSKVFRDRNAPGSFFFFTREVATQIIPLTENGQFDTSVKTRFLDYLAGQSQMSRINSDRDYIRENVKFSRLDHSRHQNYYRDHHCCHRGFQSVPGKVEDEM
ncbi:hypothetical protein EMIT0P100_160114 [Pseudomonas sp. IT-P100]|uniref:hypothetical protein n=1 Tax=Pseudomonas sp. IT-P100 TaxID=3026452 RepID=UPI0039E10A8C